MKEQGSHAKASQGKDSEWGGMRLAAAPADHARQHLLVRSRANMHVLTLTINGRQEGRIDSDAVQSTKTRQSALRGCKLKHFQTQWWLKSTSSKIEDATDTWRALQQQRLQAFGRVCQLLVLQG